MKKILCLIFSILIFSSTIQSQSTIRLNLSTGLNYTSLHQVEYYNNYQTIAGIIISGELEFNLFQNLAFSPGLNFSSKKYRTIVRNYPQTSENRITYNYLSFPFKIKYYVPFNNLRLIIYGGVSLSFFLNGEDNVDVRGDLAKSYTVNIGKYTEANDFGLLIGNSVYITVTPTFSLIIAGEYVFSVKDYTKVDEFEDYFRNLSFQVGTSFQL